MEIEKKLINACEAGDLETVKKYLNPRKVLWFELKKADVNAFVEGKGTPLEIAIIEGNKELVELLIAYGADFYNSGRRDSETPLHRACKSKKSTIVNFLVNRGANINSTDKEGLTPLHYAVKNADTETVDFLLANGADVNAKTYDLELRQKFYIDGRIGKDPSDWTSEEIYKEKDDHAVTPLHIAVKGVYSSDDDQHLQMVKLLIKNGADTNAKNSNGNTPLHLLSIYKKSYLQIVDLMKTHGANIDIRNKYGETALSILSKNEFCDQHLDYCKEKFDFFIQNGANINRGKGRSPYKEAEDFGRHNIVQYYNSILDCRSPDSWFEKTWMQGTPLHKSDINLSTIKTYSLHEWLENICLEPWGLYSTSVQISSLGNICQTIAAKLKVEYNLNSNQAVSIFNKYLGAACPECSGGLTGELLQNIESQKNTAGSLMFSDEKVERLFEGVCATCPSKHYYLVWHGDKSIQR